MFAQVIQVSTVLACVTWRIAKGATSSVSMSSLYGGSYAYGVDHGNYGAWYGSNYPQNAQINAYPEIGNLYDKTSNDDFSGYGMYSADYSHARYSEPTSYQNSNMKSYGGHKVFYKGDDSGSNYGTPSYNSFYPQAGHSELYELSRKNYAEGFEHPTSSINFNMKSYNSRPVYYTDRSLGHINYLGTYDELPGHYEESYPSAEYDVDNFVNVGRYGNQDDYSTADHYKEYPFELGYNSYDSNHAGY